MTEDVIAARARALAGALEEAGFARLRVREGDTEIELCRAVRTPAAGGSAFPVPYAAGDAGGDGRSADDADTEPRLDDLVSSDVVGIVRMLRPPVVEGLTLEDDRELAYVETLGIRNPIRSRGAGRISAVLVTDGQPVEYAQPLFAIER